MSQQELFDSFYKDDADDYSHDYLQAANQQEALDAVNWARERVQAQSDRPDEDPLGFSGVVRNVAEIPRGIGTGVIDGLNEAAAAIYQAGDALAPYMPEWMNYRPKIERDEEGNFTGIGLDKTQYDSTNPSTPPELPNFEQPETGLGNLTNELSQFLAGFIGAGKVLKPFQAGTRAGQIGKAMVQGGIADFAFMDPLEERVSNFIQAVPGLQNPVTEFLASSPQDTAMEGRLKSAIEGFGLGVAADAAMSGFRALRNARWFRSQFASDEEAGQALLREIEAATDENEARSFLSNIGDPNAPLIKEMEPEDILNPSARPSQVEINFARIDTPDDIKVVMQNMADSFKGGVDDARRGRRTFKEIQLSADQEDAWKILAERRRGDPLNAEQTLAARNLWASSTETLSRVARSAAENPSDENLFAFRKMLAVQDAIQKEVIAARTETARALASWRIGSASRDQMVEQMASLLDAFGGTEVNRELAARVAALSSKGMAAELGEFVSKGVYARSRDAVQEAWVMGLLSNPPTHMVNMMGNTLTAIQQVFERGAAARIGRFLGDETGVQIGEATAMLQGMWGGMKDGLRLAGKAFKMDEGGAWANKVELRPSPSIASENFNLAKDSAFGKTVDVIGQVVRVPGRALTAEDEFFKSVGYRAELHAQAFRQANREAVAGQIPENGIKARMAELVSNPPKNIQMAAIDNATYVTFTNSPGQFAKGWLRLSQQNPMLRFVTPFIKTPANIFNYALGERTPLAPLFKGFREDMAAGGARRQLALARASTGTATMMMAADLAFSGIITGDGPANQAERQTLMRTGWQPNSIKIGDRYFSFSRMDPIGMTLGIAANLVEIANHMDQEDREVDADEAAVHFAASIANSVMSKNYMRGLSDFMEMLAQPQARAESYANRFAGSFVPTVVANAARQVDPYMLEVNSMMDAMKARIPGLSKDLDARRDLWGRAISYRSGMGTFYDAVSPIASRRESPEPVDDEMLRLECYVATPKKTVSFDGVNVDLTRFEGAYSRYVELAGNEAKSMAWQKGCMDFLNQVVTGAHPLSELYRLKSDGPEGGKADFIRAAIMDYRRMAREQLLKEYPEIRQHVNEKSTGPLSKWNF